MPKQEDVDQLVGVLCITAGEAIALLEQQQDVNKSIEAYMSSPPPKRSRLVELLGITEAEADQLLLENDNDVNRAADAYQADVTLAQCSAYIDALHWDSVLLTDAKLCSLLRAVLRKAPALTIIDLDGGLHVGYGQDKINWKEREKFPDYAANVKKRIVHAINCKRIVLLSLWGKPAVDLCTVLTQGQDKRIWEMPLPEPWLVEGRDLGDFVSIETCRSILTNVGLDLGLANNLQTLLKAVIPTGSVWLETDLRSPALWEPGLSRARGFFKALYLAKAPITASRVRLHAGRFLGAGVPLDRLLEMGPHYEELSGFMKLGDDRQAWLTLKECTVTEFAPRVPLEFIKWVNGRTFGGVTFDWCKSNQNARAKTGPNVWEASIELDANVWPANYSRLGHGNNANARHSFFCEKKKLPVYQYALEYAFVAWIETAPSTVQTMHVGDAVLTIPANRLTYCMVTWPDRPDRSAYRLCWHPDLKLEDRIANADDGSWFKELNKALAKLGDRANERKRCEFE